MVAKKRAPAKTNINEVRTERTSYGLSNALFDELDSLRSGETDYRRASAASKLASQIIAIGKFVAQSQLGNTIDQAGESVEYMPIQLGSNND